MGLCAVHLESACPEHLRNRGDVKHVHSRRRAPNASPLECATHIRAWAWTTLANMYANQFELRVRACTCIRFRNPGHEISERMHKLNGTAYRASVKCTVTTFNYIYCMRSYAHGLPALLYAAPWERLRCVQRASAHKECAPL